MYHSCLGGQDQISSIYGIVASLVPRMAPEHSFGRDYAPAKCSVLAQGFFGIVGAGRVESTIVSNYRRECPAIQVDGKDKGIGQYRGYFTT
jgi:hypothetical protein